MPWFKLRGSVNARKVTKVINKLGRLPQTPITKAAKAGAKIALAAAKKYAPKDKRWLVRGIRMVPEKRKRGKKVYDVALSNKPQFVDIYVRKYGVNGEKRAFYPASQEGGWTAMGVRHSPKTVHYFRRSLTQHNREIEAEVNSILGRELDKIIERM